MHQKADKERNIKRRGLNSSNDDPLPQMKGWTHSSHGDRNPNSQLQIEESPSAYPVSSHQTSKLFAMNNSRFSDDEGGMMDVYEGAENNFTQEDNSFSVLRQGDLSYNS